jgi:hypothetical protein
MRHEVHLARAGGLALLPLTALLLAGGAMLGGMEGMLSALIGVVVMAVNHALAVASTGWARVLGPNVVAVSFAGFFVRLALVLSIFASLATVTWIHAPILAASFCVALVATLGAECLSYARGTYVPAWRSSR